MYLFPTVMRAALTLALLCLTAVPAALATSPLFKQWMERYNKHYTAEEYVHRDGSLAAQCKTECRKNSVPTKP